MTTRQHKLIVDLLTRLNQDVCEHEKAEMVLTVADAAALIRALKNALNVAYVGNAALETQVGPNGKRYKVFEFLNTALYGHEDYAEGLLSSAKINDIFGELVADLTAAGIRIAGKRSGGTYEVAWVDPNVLDQNERPVLKTYKISGDQRVRYQKKDWLLLAEAMVFTLKRCHGLEEATATINKGFDGRKGSGFRLDAHKAKLQDTKDLYTDRERVEQRPPGLRKV